jgi:hypothetical protein
VTDAGSQIDRQTLLGKWPGWSADFSIALAIYSLSTAFVLSGAFVSPHFIESCSEHPSSRPRPDFWAWDGQWYTRIATDSYSFDAHQQSSVAFFPAYPLLSALVSRLTQVPVKGSLHLVSHACLILALYFLLRYLLLRFPDGPRSIWYYAAAAAAFFPTTFYFRMAYSESLFLLLAVVVLYGIERGWKPVYVALLIGLATAARLTGVVLLVPLVYDLWQKYVARDFAKKLLVAAPISMWGLLLYIGYQAWELGEPLAFQKTQTLWNERRIPDSFSTVLADFVTFEPIRGVYDPECECYWANDPPRDSAALSLLFMNPIYLLMGAGLVALGWARGWLNEKEILISALLLLIPYVLQGYRTCMVSQGRYASVVFPQYIVIGHLLARLPTWLSAVLIVVSGGVLATYSAMFTSWYWYY